MRKKNKSMQTLKENDNIYFTADEKCETLARQFKANHEISVSLSDPSTKDIVSDKILEFNSSSSEINDSFYITAKYIKDLLKGLANKKHQV